MNADNTDSGGDAPADWEARFREEQQLRHAAEARARHLDQVITGLRDGLVVLDHDLRYRYVNPYTLQLMRAREEDVLGRSFYELYPNLLDTPFHACMQQALSGRRSVETDLFYPSNNRYWRALINPTDSGITVYFRDVTDVKATEAVQQRLVAIIQSSDDAIVGKTLESIVTDWNPAAERIFGYKADEIIGQPWTNLFPTDRLEEETIILDRLRRGVATHHFETIRVRKDGMPLDVSLTISPIRGGDGEIIGASIIARDITDQRRVDIRERYLAQAGQMLSSSLDYQTTLQSVADLMIPPLADWCVIYLLNSDGLVGEMIVAHADPGKIEFAREYSRRYPPDPDAPGGAYAVMRSGQSQWTPLITPEMIQAAARDDEQYRALIATGMKSFICAPLVAHGRSLGAITLIAEQRRRSYDADDVALVEEIARRAAIAVENARLFNAERERSEQLATAISEVHHRVKNSLQSVSALLEMQVPTDGESVPLEAVQDSLSQIKTIALVHDLLARDKPIGHVDVARVLRNLGDLLASSMSAGRHKVRIAVDAEPLEMTTRTATALALTLNELLTNAIKHQTMPTDSRPITVTLRRQNELILITVDDAGPGFAADFDPERDANVGLQLVCTLIEHDLRGRIEFGNIDNPDDFGRRLGGRVRIEFAASVCSTN